MTCIIAVRDKESGLVVMAADSRITIGWDASQGTNSKIIVRESGSVKVYIGVSGDTRWSDIIRYADIPDGAGHHSSHEWAVTRLVPALREAATKAGWTKKESDRESNSCAAIVVVGTDIFHLGSDWCVHWPAQDYWAIGCGAHFAEGALSAMEDCARDLPVPQRARIAVNAAIIHSAGCGAPVNVVACTL